MKYYIIIIALLAGSVIYSQDINKKITDEISGKSMLVGTCSRDAFKDSSFAGWFNSEYEIYKIDSSVVSKISEQLPMYDITIVLGTWCSDSRREVPHFFKILDAAGYPEDQLKMICVDRDKISPDENIDELNIEFVPTFIIYRDGEEMGRIIEAPVETLEEDLEETITSY